LAENLETLKNEDIIIILSPLSRTLQTITPFLKKILKKDEIIEVEKKYLEIQKKYQELRNKKQIQNYLKNPNENKLLQIHEKIYVDYRTTDIILPEIQNKEYPKNLSISKPTNQKLTPE
jgi:broad specificity phosphatase PhoE